MALQPEANSRFGEWLAGERTSPYTRREYWGLQE